MPAAVMPKLTNEQLDSVRAALATQGQQASGRSRRILERIAKDRRGTGDNGRLFSRFMQRSYERYVEANDGRAGSAGDFIKWLLDWIVTNQDSILKFVMAIISLFS